MLVLNENQLRELQALLDELPMKFGVPLVNLIRKFALENQKAAEAPKEDIKIADAKPE